MLWFHGIPLTKEVLSDRIWFHFNNPGDPIPYYYFHPDGLGVYNNLSEEIEIEWQLNSSGYLTIESEGSSITFLGKTYNGIFLGLFSFEHQKTILLFDSDGVKEQWSAFSN